MNNQPTLSWIWSTDTCVNGLRIDTDAQLLRWYDSFGCACGDSTVDQPVTDYKKSGIPGMIAIPPADVLAEINESIEKVFSVQ